MESRQITTERVEAFAEYLRDEERSGAYLKEEFVYFLWLKKSSFKDDKVLTGPITMSAASLCMRMITARVLWSCTPQYGFRVEFLMRWAFGETLESAKEGRLDAVDADPMQPATEFMNFDNYSLEQILGTADDLNVEYMDIMVLGRMDMDGGITGSESMAAGIPATGDPFAYNVWAIVAVCALVGLGGAWFGKKYCVNKRNK